MLKMSSVRDFKADDAVIYGLFSSCHRLMSKWLIHPHLTHKA